MANSEINESLSQSIFNEPLDTSQVHAHVPFAYPQQSYKDSIILSKSIFAKEPLEEPEAFNRKGYGDSVILSKSIFNEPIDDPQPVLNPDVEQEKAMMAVQINNLAEVYTRQLRPYTCALMAVQDALYFNNYVFSAVYIVVLHLVWWLLALYEWPSFHVLLVDALIGVIAVDGVVRLAASRGYEPTLSGLNVRVTSGPRQLEGLAALAAKAVVKSSHKMESFRTLRSSSPLVAAVLVLMICLLLESIVSLLSFALASYLFFATIALVPVIEKHEAIRGIAQRIIKQIRTALHLVWASIVAHAPANVVRVEVRPPAVQARFDRQATAHLHGAVVQDSKDLDARVAAHEKEETIAPFHDEHDDIQKIVSHINSGSIKDDVATVVPSQDSAAQSSNDGLRHRITAAPDPLDDFVHVQKSDADEY